MRKNAYVAFGLLVLLTCAGVVAGRTPVSPDGGIAALAQTAKITLEQARKIALKKVPGTVDEEYTFEDEDGKITTYVFIIKDTKGKTYEVQIDAAGGDVLSSEELTDIEEEDPGSV